MTIAYSSRRQAAAAILTLSLALLPAGCKRHRRPPVETIEETSTLASVVAMADPHASTQLITGFYGVEQNSWRWTAGKFAVLLRPPRSAATHGALLQLKFTIPEVFIQKIKTLSLAAYVNGTPLPAETYTKAGDYTYSREVPAKLLTGDSARVDFSLDKTMQPGGADRRDLGIVAAMIGFQPK